MLVLSDAALRGFLLAATLHGDRDCSAVARVVRVKPPDDMPADTRDIVAWANAAGAKPTERTTGPARALGMLAPLAPKEVARVWQDSAPMPRRGYRIDADFRRYLAIVAAVLPTGAREKIEIDSISPLPETST